MPNRVIREGILDSEKIDSLTWHAEIFFRRLLNVVDDYGCYDGRSNILRIKLYPLRLDKVSIPDIDKWKQETAKAGLVRLYEVSGKPYLMVENFNQTVRIKRRKYPAPETCSADAAHMQRTCCPESNPIQSKQNPNPESESNPIPPIPPKGVHDDFLKFISEFNSITGKTFMGGKKTERIFLERLKEGFTIDQIVLAVGNCFGDEYHRKNPKYLTPDFILQQEKLEKYINYQKSVQKSKGKFPDHWSSELEKKLDGKDLTEYWKHLRSLGLEPKKNRFGAVIDWVLQDNK